MLNPLIKGNARIFVLKIWPSRLSQGYYTQEFCINSAIESANFWYTWIIKNHIKRSQAFDSWRYGGYLTDNQFQFIQELIWSNCYPIA